jgi:hypothetical protein
MIIKPYISFLNYDSDGQLVIDVTALITALTGNQNFPNPTPTLAVIIASFTEFTTALGNAADGGATLTAIKNAKRAALVALIRALALYVQGACGGDLAVLKSSGFPTQKPQRQPIGSLPAPAFLRLSLGAVSGELDAAAQPVNGAAIYNWQVMAATAPTVVVQTGQTPGASTTFAGLLPGQAYIVQMNASGTAGPSNWSTTAPFMVV